jgi:hypothetical protein
MQSAQFGPYRITTEVYRNSFHVFKVGSVKFEYILDDVDIASITLDGLYEAFASVFRDGKYLDQGCYAKLKTNGDMLFETSKMEWRLTKTSFRISAEHVGSIADFIEKSFTGK